MNRVFRNLALTIQRGLGGYDPRARGPELSFNAPEAWPIFIVGAPRTGSTLLYQLMIGRLRLAFISNVMALAPRRMILITKLTHGRMARVKGTRESQAGYVPGLISPNEAGAVMRAWFESEVSPEERVLIRNTAIRLSQLCGAPLALKNLLNSLRLENIHRVFPEARFIYVRRDPLYTAQSIVLTRERELGDRSQWLGPRPAGLDAVTPRNPLFQALWQVRSIESAVEDFLRRVAPQSIEVSYAELCQRPQHTLTSIAESLNIVRRFDAPLEPFPSRDWIQLSDQEWDELRRNYAELYDS